MRLSNGSSFGNCRLSIPHFTPFTPKIPSSNLKVVCEFFSQLLALYENPVSYKKISNFLYKCIEEIERLTKELSILVHDEHQNPPQADSETFQHSQFSFCHFLGT